MARGILLVDDQADVRSLLHSALDSLRSREIEIYEAASAEDAAAAFARHPVDLLVLDYQLPEGAAMELVHRLRATRPKIELIWITGTVDRRKRDDMRNAGAAAVFEKPVPLGDFLDAVERGLGLRRTIFPTGSEPAGNAGNRRISDLLANLRQDVQAAAVLLINDRGLVVARAGDLQDSSMEVSLISALAATFNASLKAAKSIRQERYDPFSVFTGGDHDLILMAINASYALLLAASDLSGGDKLTEALAAMRAVRTELEKPLRAAAGAAPALQREQKKSTPREPAPEAPDIEALVKSARGQRMKQADVDRFWENAISRSTDETSRPDAISYEEARRRGLTPDQEQ